MEYLHSCRCIIINILSSQSVFLSASIADPLAVASPLLSAWNTWEKVFKNGVINKVQSRKKFKTNVPLQCNPGSLSDETIAPCSYICNMNMAGETALIWYKTPILSCMIRQNETLAKFNPFKCCVTWEKEISVISTSTTKIKDTMVITYPASPITLFTNFLVTWASLLDCFFGPECVNYWWNERIEVRLQEPLIDPQQDRNHNTGNAHHDWGSDGQPRMENLKQTTGHKRFACCHKSIIMLHWHKDGWHFLPLYKFKPKYYYAWMYSKILTVI